MCCTAISCCLPPFSCWRICKRVPWRSFEDRGEEHAGHRQLPETTVRCRGRRRVRALEENSPPVLPSCTSFINPNETGLPSRRTASLGYTLAILGWVGLRQRDPRSRPRGGRRHHRAPLHHPAPPPNPRPRRAPVRAWHVGDDGTPVGRRHGASRKRAVALGCRERFSRCFSQSASFSRPDFVRATARGVNLRR